MKTEKRNENDDEITEETSIISITVEFAFGKTAWPL